MKNEIPFYNDFVEVDQLPKIEPEDFLPLEGEYIYVRLTSVLMFFILGGLLLTIFVISTDFEWLVKFGILATFAGLHVFWAIMVWLEFKRRGYMVREQDIAYRRGYLFRSTQYLPFRRVQHCKISEGLVERIFNFATIVVSAAGDDIVIQGLRPEVAHSLQAYINDRVDLLNKEMQDGRK